MQTSLSEKKLQIRIFTYEKLAEKAKYQDKMCLVICEFSIRGPKQRDVFTSNNEAHLYNSFQSFTDK